MHLKEFLNHMLIVCIYSLCVNVELIEKTLFVSHASAMTEESKKTEKTLDELEFKGGCVSLSTSQKHALS